MPAKLIRSFLLLQIAVLCLSAAEPGPQPASGPGGSNYPHASVSFYGPFWPEGLEGNNRYRYFIYQPNSPAPASAPVVLFLHGYLANTPANYLVWMMHMVRKGFTVVWVQYDSFGERPTEFANNAGASWRDALRRLEQDTSMAVRPARAQDGTILTGFVGHSAGGWLSAVMAARSANPVYGYPVPRVIVPIEPGGLGVIPGETFSDIPPDVRLLLAVGEDDWVVCNSSALFLWNATPQLGSANRDFLIVRSDRYGTPELLANHAFPATWGIGDAGRLDNRDYYVTFKLSVAALTCAIFGQDCVYSFGKGSAEQISMGFWSDGLPVTPMLWTPTPPNEKLACER